PVTERLRIVKAPEEVALIRRAIEITQGAMAATFGQLARGMTERDVARLLSREMQQRGADGGGLVQFGPSSALPHGGPAAAALERETVVLIDCGCRVGGYEPPYLVEGNALRLETAMVFTDEPGIYQLGKFGVRIEDDCVMTEKGVEVLSQRASKL